MQSGVLTVLLLQGGSSVIPRTAPCITSTLASHLQVCSAACAVLTIGWLISLFSVLLARACSNATSARVCIIQAKLVDHAGMLGFSTGARCRHESGVHPTSASRDTSRYCVCRRRSSMPLNACFAALLLCTRGDKPNSSAHNSSWLRRSGVYATAQVHRGSSGHQRMDHVFDDDLRWYLRPIPTHRL